MKNPHRLRGSLFSLVYQHEELLERLRQNLAHVAAELAELNRMRRRLSATRARAL